MITFEGVGKTYGTTTVLGPVDGTIAAGGITALVGPNGAGKSTLLTIMGRLLDPTRGVIKVDGVNVHTTGSRVIAQQLSILRQDNHITARLRVRELVSYGRFPHSRGRLSADDNRIIAQSLDYLNLTDLSERFLDELSGGQRQRAFVAMVLAQDTNYVLLDEPLNNLDMRHAVAMMRLLKRATTELGKTVVLVIHDVNLAAAYADHIIALRDGQIAVQGSPAEIMRDEVLTDVFETPVTVHMIEDQYTAVYLR